MKLSPKTPLRRTLQVKGTKEEDVTIPGVQQFYYNTASLVQQREVYCDLNTMNVHQNNNIKFSI